MPNDTRSLLFTVPKNFPTKVTHIRERGPSLDISHLAVVSQYQGWVRMVCDLSNIITHTQLKQAFILGWFIIRANNTTGGSPEMRFGKMQIMHVLGISVGLTYTLSAIVGVSGEHLHGHADFIATLKLEHHGSETKYISITRTSISNDTWGKLEGTFVLPEKPDQVVFYLEGPAHGVNLLIESVMVTCGYN
ncbi:hypothetical protein L2E82_08145 [Cichorium intybus]|uniref:Uncharacterized protein n=1 Tax=Cichorium intybus TaxID=13427 RepID=A0ACB9G6C4_CICIN|nr:hypothetical protein L2E82_08145 [Cichorium intybus]